MIRALVRLVLRLLFRVEVRGGMERHDKLLLVSNHQSFLDGVLLGAFLPVMPVWLIYTTYARKWYFRALLPFYPHLPVDPLNPMAMKAAVGLIESGKPVLIFPEGRLTVTGSLMKIYEGPAFVAARTGATVVPVHIDGAAYSFFSRMAGDFPKKLFPRITITIHPPRTIPMPEARTPRQRRRIAAEAMRRIMQASEFASRRETTLVPALLDAMGLHGRRWRVLMDQQQEMSYGRFLKAVLALERMVAKLTREGDTVGLLMPNTSATVALVFGTIAMRRVPAMLNFTSGADGVRSACRVANVRLVLTSRAFIERAKLAHLIEKLEGVQVAYLEDLRARFGLLDKAWLVGCALWFPRTVIRHAKPDDPAAVLFTSGSEGKPKGVVLSHRSILANIAQLKSVIDFSSKDRFLSVLPSFHAFGLTVGAFLPLLNGCRVFLYPTPLHYRMIPVMLYEYDCTVVFATSTFLKHYAKGAHAYDFRSVRIVGAGAEKLGEDVRQTYMEKFGIRVIEGYGATECSPVISLTTPMAFKSGTVGELLPGMEYRLEPVAGVEGAGLLHVRGPNLMLGYLRDHRPGVVEPPRSEFGEGWYSTGDVVSVDESGFLTILGRVRRFAKIAGEMVSLELVEAIATSASPERRHAALTLPDPGRGESILLVTDDAELSRARLVDAARRLGAPEIAVPRRITWMRKLPLLGSGKVDYLALKAAAEEPATAER